MINLQRRRPHSYLQLVPMLLTALTIGCFSSLPVSAQSQWTTNGSDINNTNTGNVGIGTSAPSGILDIQKGSGVDALLRLWNTNASSGTATLRIANSANADGGSRIQFTDNAYYNAMIASDRNSGFRFKTGAQAANESGLFDRLTILPGGNVGIGTTTPAEALHLANSSGVGVIELQGGGNHAGFLGMWDGGSLILSNNRNTRTGNNFNTGSVGANLIIGNNGDGNKGDFSFQTVSAGTTGTVTTLMRIKASGYVGIGMANPTAKLHIGSGTQADTTLLHLDTGVSGGTAFNVYGSVNNESGFYMSVYRAGQYVNRFGVNNFGQMYLQPGGGSIGIGTVSPLFRLDVQGGQINSSGGLCIAGDCKTSWSQVGGGGSSQWTTSGSNLYYNSGKVGIGTTNPEAKLEIQIANAVGDGIKVTDAGAAGKYLYLGDGSSNSGVFAPYIAGVGGTAWGLLLEGAVSADSATIPAVSVRGNIGYANLASSPIFTVAKASGAELFRVGAGGNVGIGTAAPATPLHVLSNSSNVLVGSIGTNYGAIGFQSTLTVNNYALTGSAAETVLNTPAGTSLSLRVNNSLSNTVVLNNSGNVGIGTTSPTVKLDVNGNAKVTGDIEATGTITGGNIIAKYQDVAEWVPSRRKLPAGTVVILDTEQSNQVMASTHAYDTKVAGVVSAQPGVILGEAGVNKEMIATTGRVRVKVDATRSPVKVGDLLVTSDREGMAMKSEPLSLGGTPIHRPGTLIGKALEPLAKGAGEILVLLSLQ